MLNLQLAEVKDYLTQFITLTFGETVLNQEGDKFVYSVMAIVFSHRASKGDPSIVQAEAEGIIDFTVVRDVMYKYSKKAQERFFASPNEAFLFAAFSLSDEGFKFMAEKPDNKGDDLKLEKMKQDLVVLKNTAVMQMASDTIGNGAFLYSELQRLTKNNI